MYKRHSIWDEDKWDIHSKNYGSSVSGDILSGDKKDAINYHEQKYGSSDKESSSDYIRKNDEHEKDEDKSTGVFAELEEEKKEEAQLSEDEIPFKAASQVFSENREKLKSHPKKDAKSTIEDAIKNAIEDEKKVIIMDN